MRIKQRVSLLLITATCISFFYFLVGVNSWKFSYVGDEWSFYRFAIDLAQKNFLANPFSFTGVYSQHAILSSDYQAIFLKVLGYSNFAWRLSNIILIFPLSLFFYLWIKNAYNKNVAGISTIILQCSFYLANFFKIGYNNPQSLTLFVISLYLATVYGMKQTKKLGFLLGLTLGISFYIYIGPLFPFLIWPYLLPLLKRKELKKTIISLFFFIGTYLCMLFPALFTVKSWSGPIRAMASLNSSAPIKINLTFSHLLMNVYHNALLFYQNNDAFYLHFVTGPYLDIISRILCLLGTIIIFHRIKQKKYFLLFLSYLSTIIFLGITSPYTSSPVTRGIFFLPFGFFFAGIGLYFFTKQMYSSKSTPLFLSIIFVMIFSLNLYKSQFGVFHDNVGGYSGMALIIKSFQQAKYIHTNKFTIVLSDSLSINHYTYDLPTMLQAYNLQAVSYTILLPNDLDCNTGTNEHFIVLQYDTEAMYQLIHQKCLPKQYSILQPRISYF